MPDQPPDITPDPIISRSLSGPIFVASLLLVLALSWALYDEAWGSRPWKTYQSRFVRLYTAHLEKIGPAQVGSEKQLHETPDAQTLEQRANAAEYAATETIRDIDAQLSGIRGQVGAMQRPLQDTRAQVAALEYELDHTSTSQGKEIVRRSIEKTRRNGDFDHLQQVFESLKAAEAQLLARRNATTKPAADLREQLNEYLNQNRDGVSPFQIDGLLRKVRAFQSGIRQVYVQESGLVDRCESCHLGTREPIQLTAADMGGEKVFSSHPNPALLSLHDPARFGCTPCHNGNGIAVSSVAEAHGNYAHWQWPLFSSDNLESGCQQCHVQDRVLDQAPILTRGKDLFASKGCAGCHRFPGFDRDADALAENNRQIRLLARQQNQQRQERELEIKRGDAATTNEETKKHYAAADRLLLKVSQLDAQLEALNAAGISLRQGVKQIGPNLKEARLKLRKEWIPQWLKDPQAFGLGTKMPRFRLSDTEARAVSAFIWQEAWDGPAVVHSNRGDATRGKELFATRGCLGCHSIGEGSSRTGGEFAVNLTHIGQKANYDYIVRWVRDPGERSRPAESQAENPPVMPSLRLSRQESEDIATYLIALAPQSAAKPDVSFMDDPKLAQAGRRLVGRYGCSNCHEIQGSENTRQPATELAGWASKPIDQLDFGLLEGQAKREGWYSHKGFVEHKLMEPAIYDRGRDQASQDHLKMPDIQLSAEDLRALTTFMMGTLDTPSSGEFRTIPDALRYNPAGMQKDIQDGWWLIKKYNCMGCHSVQIGQKSVLSGLAEYDDPDMKDQLPPSLIEEGARVSPEWLARFLANPAMNDSPPHRGDSSRNGIRTYLQARMPTFNLSPGEIATLVRFFEALSGQAGALTEVKPEPLDDKERRVARALFSAPGAPCLQCHLYGDPRHDQQASAPNFLSAKSRLKPGWTTRWLLDPQTIAPGTAMPSQLFRRDGERWVLAGEIPPEARSYPGDHAQLLVRYMLQMTPEEQRLLIGKMPHPSAH